MLPLVVPVRSCLEFDRRFYFSELSFSFDEQTITCITRRSAQLLRQQAARLAEALERYKKLLALSDVPDTYCAAALLALGRLHAGLASEHSLALCHTLALAAAERSLACLASCALI